MYSTHAEERVAVFELGHTGEIGSDLEVEEVRVDPLWIERRRNLRATNKKKGW